MDNQDPETDSLNEDNSPLQANVDDSSASADTKKPSSKPESRENLLESCQKVIDYQFQDPSYLIHALTHSSSANHKLKSNERLEFLGDSILGFCVCEYLFRRFSNFLEGELTRIKSVVVSGNTCAKLTRKMGLDKFLILGKGMDNKKPPQSLLADVFESTVAAIFLDGGIEPAKEFVLRHVKPEIQLTTKNRSESNYKSQLQQITQRDFQISPFYKLLEDAGPDHQKTFRVSVVLGTKSYASAWGKSKKEAEQKAAKNAIDAIPADPPTVSQQLPNPTEEDNEKRPSNPSANSDDSEMDSHPF